VVILFIVQNTLRFLLGAAYLANARTVPKTLSVPKEIKYT